jgi:hypothetical protein
MNKVATLKKNTFSIKWIICSNKNDFMPHLFSWKRSWELAYNKKISESYVNRYYLEPPINNSIIILGYVNAKIVASSTLIPLIFKCPKSYKIINYFQYISAYILPGFSNGFSTYLKMVNLIKDQMVNSKSNFIIGFPNEKAKTLLLRLGGFKLIDVGYFIKGKINKDIIMKFTSEICKPFFDINILSWRMHDMIIEDDGYIYELYKGEKKLLDILSIKGVKKFNGYIPWWNSWGEPPYIPVDSYKFNLCIYPFTKNFSFKKSFLLSDIF